MQFYVYIIEGVDGWCYCGQTKNIQNRLETHNLGKNTSTKKHTPYKLIWIKTCHTRFIARYYEKLIKNYGVKKYATKQLISFEGFEIRKRCARIMDEYTKLMTHTMGHKTINL
jgi:predicted GIY-YIG superfamily endonuclease